MFRWKTALLTAAVLAAIAGTTVSAAEKDRGAKRLKALGLKYYWSLLDREQKEKAKEIAAEFRAETAADRLAALSRLLRYRADVAAVLTKEQRKTAGKIRWMVNRLPEPKRKALANDLLDGTDRTALAERVERHAGADPEDKVRIGFEILDQVYDALEPKLAKKLDLSREQLLTIRGLYEELKKDLRSVSLRIEKAKASAAREGLALLRPEQRSKVESFKEDVTEKVLAFLRG